MKFFKQSNENKRTNLELYHLELKAEMFIIKALEKILSDREIKKSYNSKIKKCCEETLSDIKNELKLIEENQKCAKSSESSIELNNQIKQDASHPSYALPLPKQQTELDAEKYFLPFELCCKSKSTKIVITSLDCIQKLAAYGHIKGNCIDPRQQNKLLIDTIVDSVCDCYHYDEVYGTTTTDEGIQLQIMKALLTLVTSQCIEVHGKSLLKVIKTCFNIYLGSKNPVNRTTAKATLQQMLSVIFNRIEVNNQEDLDNFFNVKTDKELENERAVRSLVNDLLDQVCNKEEDESNLVNGDSTSLTSSVNNSINSSNQIKYINNNHIDNNHLNNNINSKLSINEQQFNETQSNSTDSNSTFDHNVSNLGFSHITQKDAYLVFRSLCKLSQQHIIEQHCDPKSNEFRSKILSLQLILSILQSAGKTFQSSDLFAIAIKQYLCVALSKNGVSNILEIFQLSLDIFHCLLQHFKVHLKMQIEVFIKEIFLTILESPTSAFEHKWLVLQILTKICADAQCIVDIYVNYDCNIKAANIFERLVMNLSKIAQGSCPSLEISNNSNHQQMMRIKGLECLVSLLKCMVEWSKDLYTDPNQLNCLSNNKIKETNGVEEITRSLSTNSLNSIGKSSCTSSINTNKHDLSKDYDNFEQLEVVKQQKEIIEQGIELFNRKPKKGIQFLQDQGYLGRTPKEIAEFFHNEDRLDKTQIGEFLGESNEFNKQVMYAYVDYLNFTSKDIVSGLRMFLEGFRLPGEAQKIDRLMEKFASRYCENNKTDTIFASADTAYVLSYSIIMLTTDLHSPQVKNKMTKEQYIKMNRGINDSKDLPEEYLSTIYDEIAGSEIKMRAGTMSSNQLKANRKSNPLISEKKRKLLYDMEMEQMAATARALMESVAHVETMFTLAKHQEHVKPMFKLAWTPFLAAFSVGLQDCDSPEIAALCLEGIRYSIRIACIFQMELERNAYVQALSRFTLLTAKSNRISEMKTKNIDTIKTLIHIAHTDGNYLGKSWLDILRCISQLELAQLIGTGIKSQLLSNHLNSMQSYSTQTSLASISSLQSRIENFSFFGVDTKTNKEQKKEEHQPINETTSQSVIVAVDRIFTGSTKLDGDAIVEFVRALCQVSTEELQTLNQPRMYSLQKIVEISYYNMGRIRLQWSRIWEVLGNHFNKVCCSGNEEVAFFAIDSLRQLSMKFIEKGEFSNFRFQKDFLRPFEYIMKNNRLVSIRDMVVRCIAQMVNSQAKNIRSGWKNIFSVFLLSANDTNEQIVDLAFQTTCHIINYHYKDQFSIMIDSFHDAVKCLSEFSCNQTFPDTSMEAIALIRTCARYIAEKPHMFKELSIMELKQDTIKKKDLKDFSEEDRVWIRGWFPILFELSCVVITCKLDVRTRALTVMFEIIKSNGNCFKDGWWMDLFRIISRIFDTIKLSDLQAEKAEWMTTTCNHALYSLVDVFTQHFDILHKILLEPLYSKLLWCCSQENEQLAKSGTNCLENLVISCGNKFDENSWLLTVNYIERIFTETLPYDLLSWRPSDSNKLREDNEQIFTVFKIKSIVQVELIQTVDNIIFYPSTSKKEDDALLLKIEDELNERQNELNAKQKQVFIYSSTKSMDKLEVNSISLNSENNNIDEFGDFQSTKEDNDEKQQSNNNLNQLNQTKKSENIINGQVNENVGMYQYMSTETLLKLADYLVRSHEFAKSFNCNQEQRNVLWHAGLQGNVKPNLLVHESKSIACALRILFKIYNDDERSNDLKLIKNRLINLCYSSLEYYLTLEAEMHRDSWTSVIILIMSKLLNLPNDKFQDHISSYYKLLCDLLYNDLKPFLRLMLRSVFIKVGESFAIPSINN